MEILENWKNWSIEEEYVLSDISIVGSSVNRDKEEDYYDDDDYDKEKQQKEGNGDIIELDDRYSIHINGKDME